MVTVLTVLLTKSLVVAPRRTSRSVGPRPFTHSARVSTVVGDISTAEQMKGVLMPSRAGWKRAAVKAWVVVVVPFTRA